MTAADTNGAAILWFKHDLRVDDHPGLVAASKYRSLVPLYVFDHRILSRELHMYDYIYLIVWLAAPLNVGLVVEVE
jgi:deoxyribodipyrimidine photolyase